jgi:hypothetical protein
VDLAVYARVGEERVIPIVVENERRRERAIRLELSDWTTRGGRPSGVTTVLLEPTEFTLEPCGERKVMLTVRVSVAGAAADDERRMPADVDDCMVSIADLRLEGCDHRPLRIAIAVLPRDCDPYTVSCGCGCC